jgi:quercetin dioxygenase-like cupin family protein
MSLSTTSGLVDHGEHTMKIDRTIAAFGLAIAAVAAVTALAQRDPGFVRVAPADIRWQTLPDSHGVQQAVLIGDPDKPGMYVVRVKFPPYTMDVPHWHPNARYVTVLEGTWYTGTGDTFDLSRTVQLKPGSFMLHPAKGVHWDGSASNESVVVQIIGEGPGTTTQADPSKPFWMEVPHQAK